MNRTFSLRRLRGAVILALVTAHLAGCGMASADIAASSPSSGPMGVMRATKKAEESSLGGMALADMEAPQAQYAQPAPAMMPMEPPPPPPAPPTGVPRPEPAPAPDGPAAPAGVNAQRADAIGGIL